jgi:hypothetical protein
MPKRKTCKREGCENLVTISNPRAFYCDDRDCQRARNLAAVRRYKERLLGRPVRPRTPLPPLTKRCERCGDLIPRLPWLGPKAMEKRRFCAEECRRQWWADKRAETKVCKVCGATYSRGATKTHYSDQRWSERKVCSLACAAEARRTVGCKHDGCERPHYGKGLCRKHYDQQRHQRPEIKERGRVSQRRNRAQQRAYRRSPKGIALRKARYYRMYWGTDTSDTNHAHFIYRTKRSVYNRRYRALKRMEKRTQGRAP